MLTDAEQLELHALCADLTDDTASPEARAQLAAWLRRSEAARRLYVRNMGLSASLYEYAGEMQQDEPEPLPAPEVPARGAWWLAGALAAAASFAVGGWWLGASLPGRGVAREAAAPVVAEEEAVARLSGARDCRWAGPVIPTGDELHQGQQVRLSSGVAEIAFDSGAVVTLEGPATLELTSAWEAVLQEGTLKATVPHEAIGFRVINAEVEVVDLGTEFSMVAEADGGTEVFVSKGAVETRGEGGAAEPLVLHETEARRFAHARSTEVRDREGKLRKLARVVELERVVKPLGFLRWSFEQTAPGPWPAQTSGVGAAGLLTGETSATPGRFGAALAFTDRSEGRADLSSLAPAGPRTVAFWLKLPARARLSDPATVLGWSGQGAPVRVGWNEHPGEGPVGAVRVESGHSVTVGVTPLADGQWHHLAVVLKPNKKERSQSRLYVDGHLENVTKSRAFARREKHAASSEPALLLGRATGAAAGFQGALDELFLADRPLSPQEIRNLIDSNRPSTELTLAER